MRLALILLAFMQVTFAVAQDATPVHFKELQACFPESISEVFKASGEMDGATMVMQGMKFSNAEYNYVRDNMTFNVTLFDYNGSADMYKQAFAVFNEDLSIETEDEVLQATKAHGNPGWSTWRPKEKSGELVISINDRYIVMINGEQISSTEPLFDIYNGLELSKLP